MTETQPPPKSPTSTADPEPKENDSDIELSDVPMDEHDNNDDDDDDSEDFDGMIEDEEQFILDKLFHDVIEQGSSNYSQDDETREPEEELDEEDRLRLLMEHLDPVQMDRYEQFKRTGINRGAVKKLALAVLNQSVSSQVAIIVSGVSKVFVGELVEKALQVKKRYDKANYLIKLSEKKELNAELKNQIRLMKEAEQRDDYTVDLTPFKQKIDTIKEDLRMLDLKNVNENGPLQPEHIREAWRLYQQENHSVPGYQWRQQGERDGMMFR